jgi:hypothetical protein
MNIKTPLAAALALLATAVPSIASAQTPGWGHFPPAQPRVFVPEPTLTPLTAVPPANGSVYVYEGRRLLARLDGPGVLWLPTGSTFRIVAMRGEQVLWSGDRPTAGVPLEVRWPAPPDYSAATNCPWAYPRGPLTAPVERGRVRTPNW